MFEPILEGAKDSIAVFIHTFPDSLNPPDPGGGEPAAARPRRPRPRPRGVPRAARAQQRAP